MPWRAINEEDLRGVISDDESNAVRAGAAAAGGENDPFVTAQAHVTASFRGAIRSGPGNRLDADESTLPEAAIDHAAVKIRQRLFTRYAPELLDDDKRQEQKDADAWLKEVRRGIEKIEQPDDGPGETNQPAIKMLSRHERQATRENLKGL